LRRDKFLADLQASAKVTVDDDSVRLIQPPKIERSPNLKGDGHDHGADDGHGHAPEAPALEGKDLGGSAPAPAPAPAPAK
jgi:hypothetical protein